MGNNISITPDPMLDQIRQYVGPVHEYIANVELVEGKDSSYTIDKRQIVLRIKDSKGEYYSKETLAFIFLHCFAFTICDEDGHTPKFWTQFKSLLDKATKMGIVVENPGFLRDCD